MLLILINKNTPFILQKVTADHLGRSVVVTEFLSSLPCLNTHRLILGGDFNCVLDPILDRSSNTNYNISKSARTINAFLQMYNMSEPWRSLNPNSKHYSFFSPVHNSYSCIDYFLIDNQLMPSVKDCRYEGIVISDHGPVVLQISFPKKSAWRPWRFSNVLLGD